MTSAGKLQGTESDADFDPWKKRKNRQGAKGAIMEVRSRALFVFPIAQSQHLH